MPRFAQEDSHEAEGHTYGVYLCEGDPELVPDLAARVKELYLGAPDRELSRTLENALEGLDTVVSTDFIGEMIQQMAEAVVPPPGTAPELAPQLDIARNELAEVIAYEAVDQVHGAVIPALRVREKESPLPSRGLDLLAFVQEGDDLTLLVTEVKASSDAASPPGVVESGESCLDAQTRAIIGNAQRILAELVWARKHASPETQDLVTQAIILHGLGELRLSASPVLLRPRSALGADDFGCFRADAGRYDPATVRFIVVVIEEELDELSEAVYSSARAAAA
ncbi:MAG: hypothetical protein KGZ72_04655 [Roseovarius sp.]|jgi:hypothetical protein|nr:hypothetical protein [Roseovarius sp.]